MGVGVDVAVAVGGTGVAVGCSGCALDADVVAVGGTGVAVGGTGVAVGCSRCELDAAAVAVGGTGVAVSTDSLSMISFIALTISSLVKVAVAVGGTGEAVAVGVSSSPDTADTGSVAASAGAVFRTNSFSGAPRRNRKIRKRRKNIVDRTALPRCRLFSSASLDENIISSLPADSAYVLDP